MGFPMASNLRKKIPKESTLYVNDVDAAAVDRFVKEHTSYGPVKVLATAKEITEHSVTPLSFRSF
jgi:3-hydroxyisobutyrate/3-hydroxypropionate dehydrogenase